MGLIVLGIILISAGCLFVGLGSYDLGRPEIMKMYKEGQEFLDRAIQKYNVANEFLDDVRRKYQK